MSSRRRVRDVKRSDGDGGESAGRAFSATSAPALPSESKCRRLKDDEDGAKREGAEREGVEMEGEKMRIRSKM